MVYDALHRAVGEALGELDPSVAQQSFSAAEAVASGGSATAAVLDALNTPPFLGPRRVVVVRDAQSFSAGEADLLVAWMNAPTPGVHLVVAVVGTKAHKLVKGAAHVVEVNVGSGVKARSAFVETTLAQYRVNADAATLALISERLGDDVSRVDSLARLLANVYGTAPLAPSHVEPYLGDAGTVPPWDLTDALERGDAATSITVARRMLDSRDKAGVQIVLLLQRYFLQIARVQGSELSSGEAVAQALSLNIYAARKVLSMAQRLGPERIADAVHLIARADTDLKGGASFGASDEASDSDRTDLTVIEILVARLARLTASTKQR